MTHRTNSPKIYITEKAIARESACSQVDRGDPDDDAHRHRESVGHATIEGVCIGNSAALRWPLDHSEPSKSNYTKENAMNRHDIITVATKTGLDISVYINCDDSRYTRVIRTRENGGVISSTETILQVLDALEAIQYCKEHHELYAVA